MIDLLIIGNGFLGNNLQKNAINQGLNSHLTDYRKSGIDIRNISNIEGIINQEKPRIIINCAAISNIDLIENNSDNAFEVNAVGAKNLAIICEKLNLKLVHISTDSVFDGRGKMYTENDLPNPINEYSKSKKMGEDLIKKYLKKFKINQNITKVMLLCYPRVFGYVFNPLSIFYCYDRNKLVSVFYEVKNTFNEQHTYIFKVRNNQKIEQKCKKKFYVSPFMDMDTYYNFKLLNPGKKFSIFIRQNDKDGTILTATQTGDRKKFSFQQLFLNFFKYPLMTIKIIISIHY